MELQVNQHCLQTQLPKIVNSTIDRALESAVPSCNRIVVLGSSSWVRVCTFQRDNANLGANRGRRFRGRPM